MTHSHAEPEHSVGLLDHVERYLGPVEHTWPATPDDRDRSYAVGLHRHPELSMVTAATSGVRFHGIASPLPLEFACSARPGQEDEAAPLVRAFADIAIRAGDEVEYDDGFVQAEPLVTGSVIHG